MFIHPSKKGSKKQELSKFFLTKVGDSIILATLFSITSIRGGWRSQIMRGDNSSELNCKKKSYKSLEQAS